jgi:two-component system, OmpR family, phosphate regulon sensor histidine kinase PhoR
MMSGREQLEGVDPRRPAPRRRRDGLFQVARQGRTYWNILYLLSAFPLGLTYFVILITGFSTGLGTAVIGVGLVLLVVMLWVVWMLAGLERALVRRLLGATIAPPSAPYPPFFSWGRDLLVYVRQPLTWKSLVYLLLEFPFGVLSFCLTITLLSVSLSLLLYPLTTPIELTIGSHPGHSGGYQPGTLVMLIWQSIPQPWALILDTLLLLTTPVVGVVLAVGSLHVLNGMAQCWGHFAGIMLGESDGERELAEARARAAREQARAESADQRRRELILNVSHELRTPIANIRGHVESLRPPLDERLAESEKQRYLGIVAREAERLSALVDDLLALARADTDELRLDIRPTSVGAIVEEIYEALAPLAQRDREVTLVRTIAANLPYALADRDRLAQVLLNLARNAITATPPGGLVFLDVERAGPGYLVLMVSDTGHGIPEEDLERVFERFYRVDTARTRAGGGFGLGLSIVRDLVQAMGGTVTAAATEGGGSCFRVLLRAVPTDPDSPASEPATGRHVALE